MPATRRHHRLAAAIATAALLVPPLAPSTADARPARAKANSVSIAVTDVTPTVLPTDTGQHPLTVTLVVTNRGDQPLTGLTIEGERGEPINTQSQLEQAIKHVTSPTGSVEVIKPKTPVVLDLAGHATQEVQFRSTTSTLNTDGGLCNCTNADLPALIYPLYFTAHVKGPDGVDQSLGLARTFATAFQHPPAPVHVSWVWPLIDQPHLLDDTLARTAGVPAGAPVFTDDFLAASVASGGRLDRALAVAEEVARDPRKPPFTLLIDPELLDELQLMSTGSYLVQTGNKPPVKGGGGAVADEWLGRLRALLSSASQVHVQFTPYADPDTESLQAAGLSWSAALPPTMAQNVETALGQPLPTTTVSWPVGGAVGRATMSTLAQQGIGTVLLNGSAIRPRSGANGVRAGLARLSVDGRDVAVGILDANLQKYAQQAITAGQAGLAALPLLTAELTIRAVAEPTAQHVAVMAPPRWVDADVLTAVRVIESTSDSLATRPIGLDDAVGGQLLPNGRSHLTSVPSGVRTLPAANIEVIERAGEDLPALRKVFTPPPPARIGAQPAAVLAEIPLEQQRVAASAWGRPGFGATGTAFGQRLVDRLDQLTHGVQIVAKPGSSYTLASDNSPFPLTVRNTLPWPVTVQANLTTARRLAGFEATSRVETVEANQKASFKLATHVTRGGHIGVIASLSVPYTSHQIGDSVEMTVRNTALGTIGVIITVGAGAVLLLALLIRFGRRLRHRFGGAPEDRPHWDPDAPDAERTFAATMREREQRAADEPHRPAADSTR